jgi:hypothetical protein
MANESAITCGAAKREPAGDGKASAPAESFPKDQPRNYDRKWHTKLQRDCGRRSVNTRKACEKQPEVPCSETDRESE